VCQFASCTSCAYVVGLRDEPGTCGMRTGHWGRTATYLPRHLVAAHMDRGQEGGHQGPDVQRTL